MKNWNVTKRLQSDAVVRSQMPKKEMESSNNLGAALEFVTLHRNMSN